MSFALELGECTWIDTPHRLAARAEGAQPALPELIDEHLAQDAARGVSGAQHQHIQFGFAHRQQPPALCSCSEGCRSAP